VGPHLLGPTFDVAALAPGKKRVKAPAIQSPHDSCATATIAQARWVPQAAGLTVVIGWDP
jgi:hypothetical protein